MLGFPGSSIGTALRGSRDGRGLRGSRKAPMYRLYSPGCQQDLLWEARGSPSAIRKGTCRCTGIKRLGTPLWHKP